MAEKIKTHEVIYSIDERLPLKQIILQVQEIIHQWSASAEERADWSEEKIKAMEDKYIYMLLHTSIPPDKMESVRDVLQMYLYVGENKELKEKVARKFLLTNYDAQI